MTLVTDRTAMRVADALVELLKRAGVRVIFGYPGGHTVHMHDALAQQAGLRHVLVRHEQAAAMMADAYGRVRKEVGVCLVTAGPGATNTMSGVGEAYSDCTPLVVLACQVESQFLGKERGAYHEADLDALYAPVTKWSATARAPQEAVDLLARALAETRSGRPRPVAVILPRDVQAAPAGPELPSVPEVTRLVPGQGMEEAADLLARAEHPVIFAGGGVARSQAQGELVTLAEHLGAPVLTTPMGKGVIPEDHRLAASVSIGRVARAMCEAADVMLAVGCRFTEVATHGWSLPVPQKLIHVDVDPTPFGQTYPPAVTVLGDAKLVLAALEEAVPADADRAQTQAQRLHELWAAERAEADGWPGAYLIRPLREVLPREGIVACDVGTMTYWMYPRFASYEPNTFLTAAAYITMGWGVPAAAGAKLAAPERPVVAVTGDGGFLMSCQELATIAAEGIAVTIVVVNDRSLRTVAQIQERKFEGRRYATTLPGPDFVTLAESFGVAAERVEGDNGIAAALERGLSRGGPYLVELKREAY